jgi:hypothetical protein
MSYLPKLGDVLDRWQAQVDQETGHPYELPRQLPYLSGLNISNFTHSCVGFVQLHRQSCPSGRRRLHSSSSTRITSCTTRSISCRPRRVACSSSIRWRALCHSDWDLEALTQVR